MDMRDKNDNTMALLDTIERHGYMKIAELIDGNHLSEAGQVVDILKGVGLV